MPHSPATPHKLGNRAVEASPNPSVSLTEKLTSKVKQASSLHEPSPASTYGDTAGSSNPATPQDNPSHDSVADLARSLNAAQIDPAIQAISGSPMMGHYGKMPFGPSMQRDDLVRLQSKIYLSPSKKDNVADLLHYASVTSTPSSGHVGSIDSPTWRKDGPGFVRQSNARADDPFISDHSAVVSQSFNQGGTFFSPRKDRAGIQLSGDTAQALLPPNSCVFVANLMSTLTDDQLEHHVQEVFTQFGSCYTKIRRDPSGMPFAFVQYHTAEDAQRAITMGRGLPINGRQCRTEAAKVNRSLYLSKVTGDAVSEAEARNIMSPFGPIQEVWHCSPTDKEMYRLPEGIWVKYAYFQDCRDAQAGLRDHSKYRLEQPPTPDNGRFRSAGRTHHVGSPMQRSSPGHMLPSPMRRAATDLRSIFVGNLPHSALEAELWDLFHVYGHILHIEIIRKPSVNYNTVNTFAFIEFADSSMAVTAVQSSHGMMYGTHGLRVERKESADPAARREFHLGASSSQRAPYSPDMMSHAYQRGIMAGMVQAQTQQAIPAPMYPAYYYQSFHDPSAFGQFNASTAPVVNANASPISHGNGFLGQTLGSLQQAHAPIPLVQYSQQPVRQTYQWPPADASNEHVSGSPAVPTEHI